MPLETPAGALPHLPVVAPAAVPSARSCVARPTSWWRRTVTAPVAAGIVGGSLFVGAAALVVVQAWSARPRPLAEATHAIGGVSVALLVLAAVAVVTRARRLGGVAFAAALALAAHGVSLVLQGQTVGALLLGIAPIATALGHIALMPTPIAPVPPTRDRIDIAWAIAKSRHQTARSARRAVSPSRLAMHA